ncbi:MAG TPA: hypothetical protein VM450_12410 [Thermomicrobiales bacterium]|nr:hypothetical protein [Thermomicrobiales bacterium]
MTYRIYLAAAKVVDGRPSDTDVPVERVFVNAADVAEVWVETESVAPPEPGKAATFALRRDLSLGFMRISGTVERRVAK